MKQFKLIIVLAILVTTVLSACKKSGTPATTSNNNPIDTSYPAVPYLFVGAKSTYAVTGGLFSSNVDTVVIELIAENNNIFTQSIKFDGVEQGPDYVYYQGGYINSYIPPATKGAQQGIYKYAPIHLNDSWIRVYNTPSDTTFYSIAALNDTITVQAGKFVSSKVELQFSNAFNDQQNYYSPTAGLIRTVNPLYLSYDLAYKNF
jgi:hypothetical protein